MHRLRQRELLQVLLFGCLVLVGCALTPHSSQSTTTVGLRPELDQLLMGCDQLFVGTVDTVKTLMMQPEGPCGGGMARMPTSEFSLTVLEVIHGSGIDGAVKVRTLGRSASKEVAVGDTVVAGCKRSCADGWRLWGDLVRVDAGGTLRVGGVLRGQVSGASQSTHSVSDLRNTSLEGRSSAAPFKRFAKLHLVTVVDVVTTPGTNNTSLTCAPLSQLAGPQVDSPITIELRPAEYANCAVIAIGDSMLIPTSAPGVVRTLHLETCADYLRVERGFLPGLGVTLDQAMTSFRRSAAGYELRIGAQVEGK